MVFEAYATIAFQKGKIKPELCDHHAIGTSSDRSVEMSQRVCAMQD
jgi:hypothetical protein